MTRSYTKGSHRWASVAALALFAVSPAIGQPREAPGRPSNNPDDYLAEPVKPASIKGDFTLVAIGDMLYSHPKADAADPKLQDVLRKVRDADFAVSNQEGVFIDLETFDGTGYGLGQLWGEGTLANDMKAMGIDLVSVANNHSTDFGFEGLLQSMRLLDAAGIGHAGGGRNQEDARSAGVVETPHGKVSMVAAASTFKENAGANDAFGGLNARPGISTLRLRKVNIVSSQQFATIRALATERASPRMPAPEPDAAEIEFGEEIYRAGSGDPVIYEMDLFDHADILKSIREAKETSDLAIFTIHAHESPTGMDDDTPAPPNFLKTLFHDVVDAGADVVVGGGPHSLRGIEIYKGRPIFYGIGVFFIRGEIKVTQEAAFRTFPDPATGRAPPPVPEPESVRPGGNPASWYDGMLAEVDYHDGRARTVRVYPLDVGNTRDRSRRGIPHLADPETARRILENLQIWSAALGTRVEVEGSVGIIHIK